MQNMVYVALSILGLVALVLFVRVLRAAWAKNVNNMFTDLGMLSLFTFTIMVLATVGTATGQRS